MATSGRINTSSSNGSYFYVKWQLDHQDVANNRSLINWQAGLHISGGEYWLSNAVRIDDGNVHTDNIPDGTWSNISGAGDHQLRSGSVWVNHNSGGDKSFSASINGWLYSYGNRTKSGSWSLPTIPRATQPSIPSSFNIGTNVTISLPRASSSFHHVVTYSFNGQSGTISSNAGSSVVWAVPTALANARPNNTSGTGTITAKTYNGSTLIGTKTDSFTALIPNTSSFKPTVTSFSYYEANADVSSHFSVYVQSKSQLAMTIAGAGAYGSTVNKAYLDVGNIWSTKDFSGTSTPITLSGTVAVAGFVGDTRDRYSDNTIESIEVAEYIAPYVDGLLTTRADSDGTQDDEGDCAIIYPFALIAPVNDENTQSFTLRYKKHSDSTWTEMALTPTVDYQLDDADAVFLTGIDVDSAYDVQLVVTDYFSTTTFNASIPTAFVIMDFHADGNGMSFGKVADQTNRLEVGSKLPLHIFESNSFEGDAGFLRLRRSDDSILSYISKGADGTGLDIHMYDETEWKGKVSIGEDAAVDAAGFTKGGRPVDWWEELGRADLTGTSVTVPIAERNFMRVIVIASSTTNSGQQLRLKANTGAGFSGLVSNLGASYTSGTFSGSEYFWNAGYEANAPIQATSNISTVSARPSFFTTSGTRAALRFSSSEMDADQEITSITAYISGGASFSSGRIVILGHD